MSLSPDAIAAAVKAEIERQQQTVVYDELSTEEQLQVLLREMPDPIVGSRNVWVPFVLGEIGLDRDTVIVGHSTGA